MSSDVMSKNTRMEGPSERQTLQTKRTPRYGSSLRVKDGEMADYPQKDGENKTTSRGLMIKPSKRPTFPS